VKLLRWAAAGASVYVIYRYTIGKKARGEEVMLLPAREMVKVAGEGGKRG
jgi:hypothetical protein